MFDLDNSDHCILDSEESDYARGAFGAAVHIEAWIGYGMIDR